MEVKHNGKHLEKKGGWGKLSSSVASLFSFYLSPRELQSVLPPTPRLSVFYFDSHESPGSFEAKLPAATNFQKYVFGEFMQYFHYKRLFCNILGTLDGGYILYSAMTNRGEQIIHSNESEFGLRSKT